MSEYKAPPDRIPLLSPFYTRNEADQIHAKARAVRACEACRDRQSRAHAKG
jgi:hypothetical protein